MSERGEAEGESRTKSRKNEKSPLFLGKTHVDGWGGEVQEGTGKGREVWPSVLVWRCYRKKHFRL